LQLPYLIVQCGGLGTRMQYLTTNKPKCMISALGSPLIKHLKSAFKDSKLVIIGSYKFEILKQYLPIIFNEVDYDLIYTKGKGSASGIKTALKYIPQSTPFGVVWSDILFRERVPLDKLSKDNYIGLTNNNFCRWTMKNQELVEEGGTKNGIFGFFIFKNKKVIEDVPSSGEFVKYLSKKDKVGFKPLYLDIYEVGTIEKYNSLISDPRIKNTRFFNSIEMKRGIVVKRVVDERFTKLINLEYKWYKYVSKYNYKNIPELIGFPPLKISFINGKHPFDFNASNFERKKILDKIFDTLFKLHDLEQIAYDANEDREVLVNKTISRIDSVKPLLPKSKFKLNGVDINLKKVKSNIRTAFQKINLKPNFTVIHGDPTFSNMLITASGEVKLLDPRGYYGKREIFGNPYYDFAKLYYSCIGNYDQFNLKRFILKLDMNDKKGYLSITSNGYEEVAQEVFDERFSKVELKVIKIMHALIWLALSGYVLDDYDSIIASYLNGARLLQRELR